MWLHFLDNIDISWPSVLLLFLLLLLYLQVTEHDDEVEMKGSRSQMERSSAISKHLKLVIVKCNAIDGRITKILKFLSTFNICKITSNTIRSFYTSEFFLHLHLCERKQII